ncbi:UNKNOWN [Stylonychia lemnae]|uniref:Leucine Rich Repeat family protein n=1 Tax=Stylonychia lemnae TaxID=5949 RepID=A0A078AZR1_STYLE|nr:UNKNOWN [Stylonychia lemnae]|eukprot:CDW87586.1 UNKNOWN [Stylonychia lemnae]
MSQNQHINFEESLQSVDLNQRLLIKLESLKTSPVVVLQDHYLGDEGCRVLVEYYKQNPHTHISKLDLKGNNIGERGAIFLAQLLSENDSIKKLSLEWNNIGQTDGGLQAICQSLIHNTSLQELDLRNNRIQQSSAQYLGELIKSNRVLKRLDLKWNDIGRAGAQILLEAMKDNSAIQYIELNGNKNVDEVVRIMDSFLQRNRGEMAGLRNLLQEGIPGESNEVPFEILQKEKDFAEDIKAKYEAQVIAHKRTEKKTKEVERQLENERRKFKTANSELVRSLEEEKIARKLIESNLSKLKEDFARQELDKDKLLADISIKYDKVKIERAQYELELNKTRDAQLRGQQVYADKIATLEDQLSKSQSLYLELDESSKAQISKLRQDSQESVSEMHRKYEASLRQKTDSLRSALNEVDQLRQQITILKSELLEKKAEEEIRLNEKVKELNQLQRQFHDAVVQEQESKLRMGQVQQDKLNKFQESAKQDLDKQNQSHLKDLDQMEVKLNRLRDEKANESREAAKIQQAKQQLENSMKNLQSEAEKLKHEKSEIQNQLKFIQDKEVSLKDNIKKEQQGEIQSLQQQNQSLQKRVQEQEQALLLSRKENQQLRQDFDRLGDTIQQKVQETLDQAFLNINAAVGAGGVGGGRAGTASNVSRRF